MINIVDRFWLGVVLWFLITAFISSLLSKPSKARTSFPIESKDEEIEALRQQCLRLREELQQSSHRLNTDWREATFEQLQTLLANYPTACKMAQTKPDLPAKNLVALFTPLENLLSSWGYEQIGSPWEQVSYNPQFHQPDSDDIEKGDLVYVRFVGYRDGDKILCPAKVSRILPGNQN